MQPGNLMHFLLMFLRAPQGRSDHRKRQQRIAKVVRRLRIAVLLMLFSVFVGTVGYVLIEDYPWFDAYYMSVITLASVGFGEVRPLSNAGRLFTTFLILFNVGLFAYAISTITGIFAEGGFQKLINDFSMNKRVSKLNGHTIVCGFGRHALEVAQELAKQNMPFVVIENRPDKIEHLQQETNYLFVEGDATLDEVLEEAGILRASAVVITLPDDADNMFITLSARQLNPALRIISRANHPADEVKIRRAGADQTVMPERIGGFYMATLVNKPDLVEFFTLLSNMGPSNVVFEELLVSSLKSNFQTQSIASSGLAKLARISIVGVRYPNGQYELNPPHDLYLQPDWYLVVLGNPEQMAGFRREALLSGAA
jgi:voltage-gated potassium channel